MGQEDGDVSAEVQAGRPFSRAPAWAIGMVAEGSGSPNGPPRRRGKLIHPQSLLFPQWRRTVGGGLAAAAEEGARRIHRYLTDVVVRLESSRADRKNMRPRHVVGRTRLQPLS
jgi:hypothetical protein